MASGKRNEVRMSKLFDVNVASFIFIQIKDKLSFLIFVWEILYLEALVQLIVYCTKSVKLKTWAQLNKHKGKISFHYFYIFASFFFSKGIEFRNPWTSENLVFQLKKHTFHKTTLTRKQWLLDWFGNHLLCFFGKCWYHFRHLFGFIFCIEI